MSAALDVTEPAMIDELVDAVARAGSLSHDQATLAVGGMIRFMAARLPSPLFGEIQTRLQSHAAADDPHQPGHVPTSP